LSKSVEKIKKYSIKENMKHKGGQYMYVYLVTFHLNNGHSFEKLLEGNNLDHVKEQLHESLFVVKDTLPHFKLKDKSEVYFTVFYENISCIEYELLHIQPKFHFDDLISVKEETLKAILTHVKNDFILAVSLLHTSEELRTFIHDCLPETRQTAIKNVNKVGLGRIKMDDVDEAKEKIVQIIMELEEQEIISLEKKEQ